VIVSVFKEPLQAENILEPSEIVDVFSNVNVLIKINKELLADLEKERHRSSTEERLMMVAPTFLQLADFLKMYSIYCNNQSHAFSAVETLQRRNRRFREFLQTAQALPQTKGLSLLSFLIKPVQRICKYPLLIRQLLEHTPVSHPDRVGLEEAQCKIQDCVEAINESKRAAENVRRIVDCQNRLQEGERLSLLTGSRRFIAEAQFKEPSTGLRGSVNSRDKIVRSTWFLFSDLLIRALPKRRKPLSLLSATSTISSLASGSLPAVAALESSLSSSPGSNNGSSNTTSSSGSTGGASNSPDLVVKAWIPLRLVLVRKLDECALGAFGIEITHTGQRKYRVFATSAEEQQAWIANLSSLSEEAASHRAERKAKQLSTNDCASGGSVRIRHHQRTDSAGQADQG